MKTVMQRRTVRALGQRAGIARVIAAVAFAGVSSRRLVRAALSPASPRRSPYHRLP